MKLKLVSKGAQGGDVQVSGRTFARALQRDARSSSRHRLQGCRPCRHEGQKTRPKCAAAASSHGVKRARAQARAGSIRSPIWVGGGRAFAAKPRDFSQKVNRKMYRAAIQTMLSELARQERFVAIEGPSSSKRRRRSCSCRSSKAYGLGDNVLDARRRYDEKLELAARNLPHVEVLPGRFAGSSEPRASRKSTWPRSAPCACSKRGSHESGT